MNEHVPVPPRTPVHVRQAVRDLPPYVAGARPTDRDVAKLSSNELPFETQEPVVRAVTQAATGLNRYPEITSETLVGVLARRHGLHPEQIAVGNGSVALIQHLLDAVCEEGDEVVLPWRSFEAYPICVAVAGATAVTVPLTAEGRHDVPALMEAVTARSRALMVCTPNNPTGPALSGKELVTLLDGVPNRVLVLVDEAYLDFVTDPKVGDARDLLEAYPNLVVCRTFSKAHGLAGLRVGYLMAAPQIITAVRAVASPFGVSLPAQAAAVAACDSEVLAETARRVAAVVAERERVLAVMRSQGWVVPEAQGNFLWLGVGEAAGALTEHCARAGILVRPFAGEGVRVSIGTTAHNDRFLQAVAAWDGPRS